MRYDLSVLASSCIPDGFEENDTLNQAKPLNAVQTHNICPAGDQDLGAQLELTANQILRDPDSQPGLCRQTALELRDGQGNQIAANDDYDYVKASRDLLFEPATSGSYFLMVRHHDPAGCRRQHQLRPDRGDWLLHPRRSRCRGRRQRPR